MSKDAFIDMREIARTEAFWWVGGTDGPRGHLEGDWMAIIYRPIGGGTDLLLKYRFRYYRDDQAFHSSDRKSSYAANVERGKLADAIAACDEMAQTMLAAFGGKIYRKRFIDGTRDKFGRWLMAQPFSHTMSQAQYDKTRPQ